MAARFARAHREDSARARRGPSEASVKFFDETFFQKSFDLALALTGRAAHKRKLGKQRSVFPGRWGSERVVPRGWVASYRCALSVLANASPPPPRGEARFSFLQAFGGAPTWLPLRGPLRPGGTLPSGRSPLPRRSVLDVCHWQTAPEAAAETLARRQP